MVAKVELITPEIAKEYLVYNVNNRNLNRERVNKYARDMVAGEWQLNGEPIIFDTAGILKDGQHRLQAVIKCNKPVKMLVVRGVDPLVDTINTGTPRSFVDMLRIGGMDPTICIPAFVACARQAAIIGAGRSSITKSEAEAWIYRHEDALRELRTNAKFTHRKGIIALDTPPLLLPAMCAIETGEDKNRIFDFLRSVQTGFYHSDNDTAAIVIRNDIIARRIKFERKSERIIATYAIDKALYDFIHKYPRKMSYQSAKEPAYTKALSGKEGT